MENEAAPFAPSLFQILSISLAAARTLDLLDDD